MKIVPAIATMVNYDEVVRTVKESYGINLAKELEANNIKPYDPRSSAHIIGLCESYNIGEVPLDIIHYGYLVLGTTTEIITLSQVLRGSVHPNRAIFSSSLRDWRLNLLKLRDLGEKEFTGFVINHLCQSGLRKFFGDIS